MKKSRLLYLSIALTGFFGLTSAAVAQVVTFEDVAPENGATNTVSFGFNFQSGFSGWLYSPAGGSIETGSSANPHDSMRLAGSGDSAGGDKIDLPGPGVQMTKVGGGAFSIYSFEAATFSTNQPSDTLTIEAELQAGGMISTTVDLTTSFQTFELAGFTDIISASFYSTVGAGFLEDGFQIDNISDIPLSVNAEPVPAVSAWGMVILAGLFAFFGIRRRMV